MRLALGAMGLRQLLRTQAIQRQLRWASGKVKTKRTRKAETTAHARGNEDAASTSGKQASRSSSGSSNSQPTLFSMRSVSKVFSTGRQLFKDLSLDFFSTAKIGVIGLNGSGKSTLMKVCFTSE